MATRIGLAINCEVLDAVLNDSQTAQAFRERLPLTIRMSRWGDEYYGSLGQALLVEEAADARDVMEVGECRR